MVWYFLGGVIILKLKTQFSQKVIEKSSKKMEHNTLRNYYGYWNS